MNCAVKQKIKTEVLDELEKIWPTVVDASTQFLSGTLRRLSLLNRRKSQELSVPPPSSSSSPSLNDTNSGMKPCWQACEIDSDEKKAIYQNIAPPCEFCFQPSNYIIKADTFYSNRERQCSEPMSVPDASQADLTENEGQPKYESQSSGYASPFGNGLSPKKNSWTLGITDFSSYPSSTFDDIMSDQDRSVFDDSSTTDGPNDEEFDDDSFEVLSFEAPPESSLFIKEFQHTTSNSQNNVCDCCNSPFTSVSNLPARRCHYYGKLYCSRCHLMDYAYIPAKIVKTFDMRLYPVCRRAKSILQSNFYQPIFDIQNDNEHLYALKPLLSEIKAKRTLFQQYHAYLSTCTRIENDLNENFLKEFYAQDYLYQSIHLYSLSDLLSLKKISHTLDKAISKAKQHVHKCMICREKGFICEICKNRKDILYPFYDAKTIGRCSHCLNIYHRQCWDTIDQDCPKCYRLIQRKHEQDLTQ